MSLQSCVRVGIAVVVLAAFSVCSSSARAASDDEDSLIRQGVESRRKQNDAEALDFFRRAYDLSHSPRAAAQMGWAEIALGRWVAAAGHLEEAMAGAADPWVAKHRDTIKESYDRVRQRVGQLEILGGPVGATIAIEGVVEGTLPLPKPIRVRSGDCRFVVSAPGYEPTARTVDVAAGQLTRETVNLSKVASSGQASPGVVAPPSPSSSGPVVGGPDTGAAPAPDGAQPADTARPNHLPTVGIVLASAGVVAVGAGVYFSVKTRAAGEDAANAPMYDPNADSTAGRYQTLQYVAYGVGAALIAAGVTTYMLGIKRNNDGSQPQIAVVPAAGGGAAVLLGRF